MENKFISSKSFDICVYIVGGIVLICSEIKRLALKSFHAYNQKHD